jgi:hypothetical protein
MTINGRGWEISFWLRLRVLFGRLRPALSLLVVGNIMRAMRVLKKSVPHRWDDFRTWWSLSSGPNASSFWPFIMLTAIPSPGPPGLNEQNEIFQETAARPDEGRAAQKNGAATVFP